MIFLSMAWRNVWRNRRRSILTIMAIALGLAFAIFMGAIGDGFHEEMVDNTVRAFIGHIEIHREGYHNDPALNKTLPDTDSVLKAVRGLHGLRGYSLRVLGEGLASTADNSAGVEIAGVDPAQEPSVTTINRSVIKGAYLNNTVNRPILIGDRLATTLQAGVGDKVVLLAQGAHGDTAADMFVVEGIFRSGLPDMDKGMVFLLLTDAQSFLGLGDKVTEATVLLSSSREVPTAQSALQRDLSGKNIEILSWDQVQPFLKQFIQIDDAFLYIIIVIFFVVISIGILNTIMMSIFERVREFGVMMALGTKPRQIVGLVLQESFVLAIVGIVIGCLLGGSATLYFAAKGINLSAFSEGAAAIGITSTVVYTKLTLANLFESSLFVLAVVVPISLYPASHAARLRPVDAIRHI